MSIFSRLFSSKITPDTLQKALKKGEFVFYYQPEFNLKTGEILGVEALMRWENNKRGIVPPNEFIPVLEQSGLINDFTEFLLKQTLSDLRKIHDAGFRKTKLAVNLSVIQLRKSQLLKYKNDMWICEDIPLQFLSVVDTTFNETNERFRRMLKCLPHIPLWQKALIGNAVNLNVGWLKEPHTLHTDRLYRIDYEQIR
jgi:sensor c-di-GMP phosphodiesterase-like protein